MDNPELTFSAKLKVFLSVNKFVIIFIAGLSILSFSTTGYLLIANNKMIHSDKTIQESFVPASSQTLSDKQAVPKSSPTATPTPKPVLLTDPTASWSAFTSKYSYSIKYPPGWSAQISTQQDPKILEYVVFNPVATKAGTLSITLSYGTRTYAQALALDPQTGLTISVASISATKKDSKDSNGYEAANVIVPFGSNTIIFNAKNTFLILFNQMLTTLKLTK